MSPLQALGLLAVGTLAGFDLVSGPQVLLARPLVAGTLAGLVLGDVGLGVLVGGTLELFALEVLPVGATRYPDHGPGTVGAVYLATALGAGAAPYAVLLALAWSELGGWTLRRLRRANGRALAAATDRLEQGDPGVAGRLQAGGALRDLARASLLAGSALLAAWALVRAGVTPPANGVTLWMVIIAAGLAGAVAGAIRTSGHSLRGIVLGVALVAGWLAADLTHGIPLWGGR